MVRIIRASDRKELGITDAPTYIKLGDNCFTNATEQDAIGVAYQSTPYNLLGHDEIKGAETVILSPVDSGSYIVRQQKATEDTDALLVDQEYRLTLLELGVTE